MVKRVLDKIPSFITKPEDGSYVHNIVLDMSASGWELGVRWFEEEGYIDTLLKTLVWEPMTPQGDKFIRDMLSRHQPIKFEVPSKWTMRDQALFALELLAARAEGRWKLTAAYRNASTAAERERALVRLREFGFESLSAADRYLRASWRQTMYWGK